MASMPALALIRQSADRRARRASRRLLLFGACRPGARLSRARPRPTRSAAGSRGLFRRQPRERRAAPRATEIREERAARRRAAAGRGRPSPSPSPPSRSLPAGRGKDRKAAVAQPSLALGDNYQLPTLDLLAPPPQEGRQQIDQAGLERNARLLETVLDDFNVKGEIVEVRPGPGRHDVRARARERASRRAA